ncbi:MAG TPA: hypothetical protein VFY10_02870 [Dehalococcoidia bacterium]|nr:hypothetical protein [Dehalococcoidia bacterium]
MKVKRLLIGIAAAVLITGSMAVPAFAGTSAGSQASDCGATHGAFADVNGNFGFLGDAGGTPGYHNAVGQQPGATGYNNSSVDCSPSS